MSAAVFVFDIDGRVVVYDDKTTAEQSLEAIDIEEGEYPIAYTVTGDVLIVETHRDKGQLTATGASDIVDLRLRLSLWRYGPTHLAKDPHSYAQHELGTKAPFQR